MRRISGFVLCLSLAALAGCVYGFTGGGLPAAVTEAARYEDAKLTAWRLVSGADTVEFARLVGPPLKLVAEVRQAGERIGRVETVFAEDGTLKSSRLDIPRAPARLDLTYVSSGRTQPFAPDIWLRPEP